MSGHTAGPWSVGKEVIMTKAATGPTRHLFALSWLDEQGMADARLAAAAPELLEALERALNFGLNTQSEFGIVDGSEDEFQFVKLARAAIAKARGEAA